MTSRSFERGLRHDIICAMKTCAIIAEYNPFHRGHAWQIKTARETLGKDAAVICVMSGCFTQRGEPALLDKWARTRMALASGASLVIELPIAYALSSAERFAEGGVQTVAATGLDCQLLFGSENGQLEPLKQAADYLSNESDEFKLLLRQKLDAGLSFPAARQASLAEATGRAELAELLRQPNNILAVEYLKALNKFKPGGIQPMTLKRQGQDYLDSSLDSGSDSFASASAIRKVISQFQIGGSQDWIGLFDSLQTMMPKSSLAVLLESLQTGPGPLFADGFSAQIISGMRTQDLDDLDTLPGMGEGLGRRLAGAAARPSANTGDSRLEQLIEDAATRRFPKTRIQRALFGMLLGITAKDLEALDREGPQYLRILGFDRKGRHLLKIMRKKARLPIFMNASDSLEHQNDLLRRLAALDCTGVDLWMLAAGQACGRDFDTPAVMR